jgi:Zn-dependent M28 family amino/carboxypeptidase
MLSGVPKTLPSIMLGAGEQAQQAAEAHGAAGAIIIPSSQYIQYWNQMRDYLASQQELGLPPRSTGPAKPFPAIIAGANLIKAIANLMGKEVSSLTEAATEPLKPATIPASAEVKLEVEVKDTPPTQNVVAILEGSDARLKDEYVVFSAHYDHLQTAGTGEVYNGADDDGSGTVSVLEIAQAFATGARPKRSILIIFHTGEELGLFGSQYNADYEPVVPMGKLVADFNIDMIGRSRAPNDTDARDKRLTDKDSVYVIGSDKLSTELHQLSEQTNSDTVRMRLDYTYNDENHPERFYYRSDHYNYAKHGVPIIFYFTGVHRDYHRTTDDVDKIDFEKMERITKMIFATGWRVANLDHRVAVDKKPAGVKPMQ